MSCRTSSNNIINIDNAKSSFSFVPYSITRNVMKQDELEHVAGYDRHKDSRKMFCKQLFYTHTKSL